MAARMKHGQNDNSIGLVCEEDAVWKLMQQRSADVATDQREGGWAPGDLLEGMVDSLFKRRRKDRMSVTVPCSSVAQFRRRTS
jgi:hypothetical protein